MFLAIIFIIFGAFLLLDALGIIAGGSFWGLFLAIFFLAIGFKMLAKKGNCPMCSGVWWSGKFHEKMRGECCGQKQQNEEKN